ncbi:hypothetical protein BaRGS_00012448 [Batillaria attramentaria]|uniref:Uncharacterized protein n=1 Tax=Batillaria attramentaria TaxID=370345 RepID=A0ABD0LA96_9CAEN
MGTDTTPLAAAISGSPNWPTALLTQTQLGQVPHRKRQAWLGGCCDFHTSGFEALKLFTMQLPQSFALQSILTTMQTQEDVGIMQTGASFSVSKFSYAQSQNTPHSTIPEAIHIFSEFMFTNSFPEFLPVSGANVQFFTFSYSLSYSESTHKVSVHQHIHLEVAC